MVGGIELVRALSETLPLAPVTTEGPGVKQNDTKYWTRRYTDSIHSTQLSNNFLHIRKRRQSGPLYYLSEDICYKS